MSIYQSPQTDLRAFESKPTCEKCGGENVGKTYHEHRELNRPCHPYIGTEHLCVTCRGCNYAWSMETWDGVPYATEDED